MPADYNTVYINDLDKKELVTLTKCILASSYYVPLIVTFKGAYYLCKKLLLLFTVFYVGT
jgi:hypothetical protein